MREFQKNKAKSIKTDSRAAGRQRFFTQPDRTVIALWLRALVITTLLFGLIASGFTSVFNNDVGFHIRIGATIWDTGNAPSTDHYSYTADGADYLDQEWLSQLLLYWTDRFFGVPGLVVLKGLLLLAAFALIVWASRGNFFVLALTILACGIMVQNRLQIRPHMLSWVFIGALLVLQKKSWRTGITVLLALWANSHASFVLAVLMSLIWAAEKYSESRDRKWILWAAAFFAAPCLNPYGPRIYMLALKIRGHVGFVSEWQRYSPSSIYFWLLAAFLLLLAVDIIRRREGRLFDGIRLVLLATLAFSAMRHGIVSMLYLAPMMSRRYGPMCGTLRAKTATALAVLIATVSLAGGAFLIAEHKAFRFRLDHYALPVAATDFIERHQLKGNLFNDYNFGGYLLWRAYPKHKVFVDGRLEVYGQGGVLEEYLKVSQGRSGWQRVLQKHEVAFCVVRADRNIAYRLSESSDWELVYFDYNAAVFVRQTTVLPVRRLYLLTPWGNKDRTRIDDSIAEAQYLISENPLFFGGYKILAFLLYRKGDFSGARDGLKRYLELRPRGIKVAETQSMINALQKRNAWP